MKHLAGLLCISIASTAFCQSIVTEQADAALLRGLDRVSGEVVDIELPTGSAIVFGTLQVIVNECRYPQENPAGDAFTHLRIYDFQNETHIFEGWMIASSPALMALDHSRYDVWVLRCLSTSE